VWLPPVTVDYPTGQDYRRAEPKRLLALAASEVPQVPRGTLVVVAEEDGGPLVAWTVDETERIDFDHHRLLVVPEVT